MPKPPWDESLPGKHPVLRDLTSNEEEVKNALGSSPMLTVEEKWKAHLLGCIQSYEANLKLFMSPQYNAHDKASKVKFYRRALVECLGDLGRFDEALAFGCTKAGKPFPGVEDVIERVLAVKAAVELDDDAECDCERPKATLEDERFSKDSPHRNVEIAHNRRHIVGQVVSERHGKVVSVWRCGVCGHMNAHDKMPERQIQIHNIRADIAARARHLQQAGVVVTAQNWQSDPIHQDAVLLKE